MTRATHLSLLILATLTFPATGADPKDDARKTIAELSTRGYAALAAGNCEAAIESLLDARSVGVKAQISAAELRDVEHAAAVAYMRLGLYDKASPYINRSLALKPSGREEITNLAVFDLKTKRDVIRSVWYLKDFIATQKDVDEPTLILFGACMDIAAETQKVSANAKRFNESANFYVTALRKLELTRNDGQRLWGSTWISGKQMEEMEKRKAALQKRIQNETEARRYAESELARCERNAERQRQQKMARLDMTESTDWDDEIADYRRRVNDARDTIASCVRQIPRPDFPKELPTVLPARMIPMPSTPGTIRKIDGSRAAGDSRTASGTVETSGEVKAEPAAEPVAIRSVVAFAVGVETLVAPAAVADADVIVIEGLATSNIKPQVVKVDREMGLAVLKIPGAKLTCAPIAPADFAGEVNCVGFPTVSLFSSATEHVKGRMGKPTVNGCFVALVSHPRLTGAPLVDNDGKIVGVAIPNREDPSTKIPVVPALRLKEFLADQGLAEATKGHAPAVYQVTISLRSTRDAAKVGSSD